MQEKRDETQYIKYAKRIIELCKRAGVPRYSNKFSNHVYTVYQHLVLLSLRQYEQKGYERFVKDLPDKSLFLDYLDLETIPHFTALQKFAERLKRTILDLILAMALARTGIHKV